MRVGTGAGRTRHLPLPQQMENAAVDLAVYDELWAAGGDRMSASAPLPAYLLELGLTNARQVYPKARREGLTHERSLLDYVKRECLARRQRRFQLLLQDWHPAHEKSLDSFDFSCLAPGCAGKRRLYAVWTLWPGKRTCWCSTTRADTNPICCAAESGTGAPGPCRRLHLLQPAGTELRAAKRERPPQTLKHLAL